MKKFIIIFALFISLLCISSFSWALTLDNVSYMSVDLSECNNWINNSSYSTFNVYSALSDLGYSDSDILLYTSCSVSKSTYNNQNCILLALARAPFYMNNMGTAIISASSHGVVLYIGTDNSQIGYLMLNNQSSISVNGLNSSSYIITNYLYNNSSLDSAYIYADSFTNADFFNTTFFNNAFNYTGEQPGESGGEGDGEEEENNTIVSSIGEMLIHIVVPTSEQWESLQDSFEDNVLDRFNLTSMSFNDDLNYNWRCYNTRSKYGSYL